MEDCPASQKMIFPITEIISKKDFFDFEAKYTSGMSDEITPAQISDTIKDRIQSLASTLYDKLNCFGMVRFDFILENETRDIYFLEVNTIPGQSENSIVPQQIRAMGKTIKDVYTSLIHEAINRQ